MFLTKNMLDNQGNRIMAWPKGEKRGGFDYYPPLEWVGFGLKVLDKYDSNDWLTLFDENGWAVAYHGVGRHSNEVGKIVKLIITGGFKPGMGQIYRDDDDKMNPGKKVGIDVYFQKNPGICRYN